MGTPGYVLSMLLFSLRVTSLTTTLEGIHQASRRGPRKWVSLLFGVIPFISAAGRPRPANSHLSPNQPVPGFQNVPFRLPPSPKRTTGARAKRTWYVLYRIHRWYIIPGKEYPKTYPIPGGTPHPGYSRQ